MKESLSKHLMSFLEKNNIDLKAKKIVLAVSTGLDSMSLLHAFLELRETLGFEIVVGHVNHNKRVESKEEEVFIRNFCEEKNIKLYVKSLEFNDSSNFQDVARSKRYEFFYEILEKEKTNMLFLAHHNDDLAETIIMRLVRGTSLNGYSGFHAVSRYKDYLIFRPLIDVSKDELYAYQKELGFKYYTDKTNFELDYTRNKVRSLIVPYLKELDPLFLEKIREFSYDMENESEIVMDIVHDFIGTKVTMDGSIKFSKADLDVLSPFLRREVLFEVLKPYKLSKKNIEEIMKWIYSSKVNFKQIYKDLLFLKEYDQITISSDNGDVKPLNDSVIISDVGTYRLNDNILINVSFNLDKRNAKSNELCYNSKKLPITIRPRKSGDKIKLSFGEKKVKNLLIDQKVELSRREKVLVALKDDDVLCVFGVRKSSLLDNSDNDIIIRIEEE